MFIFSVGVGRHARWVILMHWRFTVKYCAGTMVFWWYHMEITKFIYQISSNAKGVNLVLFFSCYRIMLYSHTVKNGNLQLLFLDLKC